MYIDCESVYSSSSAVKQTSETLQKINSSGAFVYRFWLHSSSCHHRLKMSSFSLDKNRFLSIDLHDLLAINVTTAFTILNCFGHEFLKGFLAQGRQQKFWKFSIFSNIRLGLEPLRVMFSGFIQQLPAMFTCRDGKGSGLVASLENII